MTEIPTITLTLVQSSVKPRITRRPSRKELEWHQARRYKRMKDGRWIVNRKARQTLGLKKLKRRGGVAKYQDPQHRVKGWVKPSYMYLWTIESQPDLVCYYDVDVLSLIEERILNDITPE